jgi:L-fucose isomerase-like protein
MMHLAMIAKHYYEEDRYSEIMFTFTDGGHAWTMTRVDIGDGEYYFCQPFYHGNVGGKLTEEENIWMVEWISKWFERAEA